MHDAEHSTEQNEAQDSGMAENPVPESQLLVAELEEQKKAFAELNDQFLGLLQTLKISKNEQLVTERTPFRLQMNDSPLTFLKWWITLNGH